MSSLISILLVSILFVLSALHFYWAFGGKWALNGTLPQNEKGETVINPKAFDCIVVAMTLLAFGLFVLIKSNLISIDLPHWLNEFGLYFLAFIFTARAVGDFKYVGFFKKIKHTTFGILDTKIYAPLCLLIGILLFLLEIMLQ